MPHSNLMLYQKVLLWPFIVSSIANGLCSHYDILAEALIVFLPCLGDHHHHVFEVELMIHEVRDHGLLCWHLSTFR